MKNPCSNHPGRIRQLCWLIGLAVASAGAGVQAAGGSGVPGLPGPTGGTISNSLPGLPGATGGTISNSLPGPAAGPPGATGGSISVVLDEGTPLPGGRGDLAVSQDVLDVINGVTPVTATSPVAYWARYSGATLQVQLIVNGQPDASGSMAGLRTAITAMGGTVVREFSTTDQLAIVLPGRLVLSLASRHDVVSISANRLTTRSQSVPVSGGSTRSSRRSWPAPPSAARSAC
jgi:hypothetical protein